MSGIVIRPARNEDAAAMRALALSHKIDEQRSEHYSRTGYLIWPQKEEAYIQRIKKGYTVAAEKDGKLVGFVMAGKLDDFRAMQSSTGSFIDKLSRVYPGDISFIDQIAVDRSQSRQGIGSKLVATLIADKPGLWIADIIHAPRRNEASISFFTSHGFVYTREIPQDEWTIGLYERTV